MEGGKKKISSSVSDKIVNFGRKSQRFIQRNKSDRALNLIEFELVLRAPPFYTRKSYRFPEGKRKSFPEGKGGTGSLLAGWSRHWLTDWLKGSPNFSVGPRRSLPPNLKSHGWAVSAAEHALGGWWVGL